MWRHFSYMHNEDSMQCSRKREKRKKKKKDHGWMDAPCFKPSRGPHEAAMSGHNERAWRMRASMDEGKFETYSRMGNSCTAVTVFQSPMKES